MKTKKTLVNDLEDREILEVFVKFVERFEEITKVKKYTPTVSHLKIFINIAINPKKTLGEVRDISDVSQSTMYRTTEKFIDLGLGDRVEDTFDPRQSQFKFSKKGRQLITDIVKHASKDS